MSPNIPLPPKDLVDDVLELAEVLPPEVLADIRAKAGAFARLLYETSAGCSQGKAVDEYRAALGSIARLQARIDVAESRGLELAKWIVDKRWNHLGPPHDPVPKDHACAQCVPDGEIVIAGFECSFHLAQRIVAETAS